MSTREIQKQIIDNMRQWQKIENASVASTGNVIDVTEKSIEEAASEVLQLIMKTHLKKL